MLSLRSATDEAWLARALAHLDEILLDHAHCEKKAASSAVSLLFKYAEREELLAPLSRLAREELAHFEEVLAVLTARGIDHDDDDDDDDPVRVFDDNLLRIVYVAQSPVLPHRLNIWRHWLGKTNKVLNIVWSDTAERVASYKVRWRQWEEFLEDLAASVAEPS